jgi:uncharacterized protein YndB with AHSA1/START domain
VSGRHDGALPDALPPVRKSVVVPLGRLAAFDLFIRRLPEWWPLAARSVALEDAVSCHVEPRVGGRLYEVARDGREHHWGTFLALEPGSRALFTWHPGVPSAAATEVEVRFEAQGNETRVEIEHRHWERLGARASFVRGLMDGGWPGVLARFEALARNAGELPAVSGPGCIPRGEA